MAYILGEREFYGHLLQVDERVLIPRPDTETLVEQALERLQPGDTVLDVGTGSGAVLLALGLTLPGLVLHGSDLSEGALTVAKKNAERLGVEATWHRGSLLEPVGGLRFSLIVSNPPYVRRGEPLAPELGFEPEEALFAEDEGYALLERLIATAPPSLLPGGWLLLEFGAGQEARLLEQLSCPPWGSTFITRDLAGLPRVLGAQLTRAREE